jgi:hypothetical protein
MITNGDYIYIYIYIYVKTQSGGLLKNQFDIHFNRLMKTMKIFG